VTYWTGAAAVSLFIWIYLVFARGGFWRIRTTPATEVPTARRVIAVVPARNEADVIGETIASLLHEDFPTPLHVVLVDDASNDGTADAARQAAQKIGRPESLTVLSSAPLPPGWTGKLWAVSQGVQEALKQQPDYLLFTDADIRHHSHSVAELVAKAEAEQLDLTSYMVRLSTSSFAEKALIPAFVYLFLQLYPPQWVASAKHRTAGAAGGCLLVRPGALARIGGHAAIRGQIIDDCALARAVKSSGGKIWMGLTAQTQSIRPVQRLPRNWPHDFALGFQSIAAFRLDLNRHACCFGANVRCAGGGGLQRPPHGRRLGSCGLVADEH
jgi:hopene-associated glycosyltransferase HpnB